MVWDVDAWDAHRELVTCMNNLLDLEHDSIEQHLLLKGPPSQKSACASSSYDAVQESPPESL